MDEPWEESLDLDDEDDSDLFLQLRRPLKRRDPQKPSAANPTSSPPFLPLRRCPSLFQTPLNPPPPPPPPPSPPRCCVIPGPAGTVQAAMNRRRRDRGGNNLVADVGDDLVPTQEYIRRAVEDGGASQDDDFARDPWLCAVDFIRREGLVDGDGAIGVPLSSIKGGVFVDKVPQVVAIVKSCTPNGFGDMMVTLKDPTGTIHASIHRKVFTEGDFGKHISIGSVVLLKKVAVFAPSRSAHYLNITLSNVIKVISKDGGPPLQQPCSESRVTRTVSQSELIEQLEMPIGPLSSQGRTKGILSSLRQSANVKMSTQSRNEMEGDTPTSSCPSNGANTNPCTFAGKEISAVRLDVGSSTKGVPLGTNENNSSKEVAQEPRNLCDEVCRHNILDDVQHHGAASDSVGVLTNQENGNIGEIKQKQPANSRASLPQWTDEQLNELFAFD